MPSGNWLPFEMLPSEMLFFRLVLLSSHYLVNRPPSGGTRMYWQGTRGRCAFALEMWVLRPREQLLPGEGRIIPLSARGAVRVAAAW